jgi:hypothetical protein
MSFTVGDWIQHSKFGNGYIAENRVDRFLIRFDEDGEKLLLKTADLIPGTPHRTTRKSQKTSIGKPRFILQPPKKMPPIEFDYLVQCFRDRFEGGFDGKAIGRERNYKEKAAERMEVELGKRGLRALLKAGDYSEAWSRSKRIVGCTNLLFPQEKMKFKDAIESSREREFCEKLEFLLYGTESLQARFESWCSFLGQADVCKWTTCTYFQFLSTRGELMFMKPAVTKKVADSLGFFLGYRPEPSWEVYSKLQDFSALLHDELTKRGLKPRSGIDIQSFIWASVQLAER